MSEAERAAKRAAHIARLVAEAPPLTDEQIDRIAVLLRPRTERSNAEAHAEKDAWDV